MFTSYAKNFEDIILWRALKNVENGFYIDIGAQDPSISSVSRCFYERGWRGFNIEPTKAYADKLRANRPDERIFQVAVGAACGQTTFFEFPRAGLSTADRVIAESLVAAGFHCVETSVRFERLSWILEEAQRSDVHWMRINVEGMEGDVLNSWDECTLRPWILIVRFTTPLAARACHENWEVNLFNRGYVYVYTDGINRYYVSEDHEDLKGAFELGAIFFDEFIAKTFARSPSASATVAALDKAEFPRQEVERRHAQEARCEREVCANEMQELKALLWAAERRSREAEKLSAATRGELARRTVSADKRASDAERRLREIHASNSWHITAPLRTLSSALRGDRAVALTKKFGRPLASRCVAVARRFPWAKSLIWRLVSLVPGARAKLIHFVIVRDSALPARSFHKAFDKQSAFASEPPVSLRARSVCRDLQYLIWEQVP